MTNTLLFLKNYPKFGSQVRIHTAKLYLETLKQTRDEVLKKVMMLRITEELISSTEDLALWVYAVREKESPTKRYRDIWELLLGAKVGDLDVKSAFRSVSRVRTVDGLMKKLNFTRLEILLANSPQVTLEEDRIIQLFKSVLRAIKASKRYREIKGGVLIRFHNKAKHGMMVLDQGHEIFIRDMTFPKKRRRNRNLYLLIDVDKAESMVNTIQRNADAVSTLASTALLDYIYKFKRSKFRRTKKIIQIFEEVLAS